MSPLSSHQCFDIPITSERFFAHKWLLLSSLKKQSYSERNRCRCLSGRVWPPNARSNSSCNDDSPLTLKPFTHFFAKEGLLSHCFTNTEDKCVSIITFIEKEAKKRNNECNEREKLLAFHSWSSSDSQFCLTQKIHSIVWKMRLSKTSKAIH